jgi:DNA-binding beta-propeller fold protein YncE
VFTVKKRNDLQAAALLLTLILFSVMGEGCFFQSVEEREPLPELVWPSAPEKPRIRFINSLSRPEHLEIRPSAVDNFLNFFSGKAASSMIKPYGVETDALGRLYVVDTALKTVHVYDRGEIDYYTLNPEGAPFASPIDIAIDDQRGHVYVSDSEQKVIKIFQEWGKSYVGEIGKGTCERPTGLTINKKTSELLVVDTLSANILRYGLNDRKFRGAFGGDGTGEGRFRYPTNICAKEDGTILVSDSLNFRIQVFSPTGDFLGMFGSEGDRPGYFTRPRGVAVDSDENIYVVDGLFDNIQIFDSNGRVLMAFGNHGTGYGEFWLPAGIFIDKDDRIYVSDCYNKRVQIFQYLKKDEVQE